ncbi:3'-5' exonuclease [Macromonas nakdongensis]|uniref:3'-5' exonuclease n=1 Tax=Macromonas nakdongensis TaxID=1843082 RepID=UPI000C32846C|nr:exonuclease domain-containing protein [Macromonas nakdongensis]
MSAAQTTDRRLWWLLGAAALLSLLWLGATAGLVALVLGPPERAALLPLLDGRLWPVGLAWAVGMVGIAWGLQRWFAHWITPSVQLAEEAQVLLATDVVRELPPKGSPETRALAGLVNQLVAQRETLRQQMDAKVREAAQGIEQEKSRLAALMSELTQSVVVCNLDGRILLYNQRARLQFRALSAAPRLADGAELIGLGRSIYAVFDRQLVAHALDSVQQRLRRGAASPSAQFVTATRAGQLLRVQMAPVRQVPEALETPAGAPALSGFVLMLDNITRDFEEESARDRLLFGLTEGSRSSLANLQAAVDVLDYPDLEPAMRERFLGVVRDEVRAMGMRLQQLVADTADGFKTRWPMEDMLGADLLGAASQRITEATGLPIPPAEVDAALWLRVESFSLMQALVYLAARLQDEFGVRGVSLRLQTGGEDRHQAWLDLVWSGQAMSTETVMGWELDPMRIGSEVLPLSVRDVVERHAGAFWFERDRVRQQAFFRFLLPTAQAQEPMDTAQYVHNDSRPEYYDFDLFRVSARSQALEDTPLTALAYTVFDTETTGLNPSQGDEILQIGATRIVNGKLLRHEGFEQLVHPGRDIPAASIPIHGITPEMVRGQPDILEVLPAFHAFAQDTVLVAHNAAFDMRFLQLKERVSGLVFDQPVLDTLLLSAVVHPQQDSHRLEAIAARFNVTVIGRHTAMGDAMVTAEVFLKLIPLLAEKGIHTLGQARAAAERTYYARLKY